MRKGPIGLGILLLTSLAARGEVYVRGVHHIPGGYRYARDVRPADIVNEWWLGKDKVAFSSTGWAYEYGGNTDWRLVLNRANGRMILINLSDKTYWEVPLTAAPAAFVDEAGLRWLPQFKTYGRLTPLAGRARVLDRPCREVEISEWIIRNDEDRFNDFHRRASVAEDVPFDWRLAQAPASWVAGLFNPQGDYLAEQRNLGGFILASEEETSEGGSLMSWSFKVSDIREGPAPAGIFDPPPGFRKLEKVDLETLFSLRGIVFINPLY